MNDAAITILAWLGGAALGAAALINGLIAAVSLLGGQMISAMGETVDKLDLADAARKAAAVADAETASHNAKLFALGFGALAVIEVVAAILLKSGLRTIFIPIVAVVTLGGWIALAAHSGHVGGLDVAMFVAMPIAIAGWWNLPRPTRAVIKPTA
jgi:hypothetical protein